MATHDRVASDGGGSTPAIPAILNVEIHLDATPIRGEVWRSERAEAQPFAGWLELAAAIEAARSLRERP